MTSSSTCSITKIHDCYIRASVYKDDGSEISRDPRTKTPQNWARMTHYGFQITSNSLPSYTYAPRLSTCPQFPTREFALTRFRVIIIIIFFFFRPASSLPEAVEALIFSQNVSKFSGGVHAYQAIVCFLPQVTTVDR